MNFGFMDDSPLCELKFNGTAIQTNRLEPKKVLIVSLTFSDLKLESILGPNVVGSRRAAFFRKTVSRKNPDGSSELKKLKRELSVLSSGLCDLEW